MKEIMKEIKAVILAAGKGTRMKSDTPKVLHKIFEKPLGDIEGLLMYDVNGQMGPNTWGKDVFGLNIYKNKFAYLNFSNYICNM